MHTDLPLGVLGRSVPSGSLAPSAPTGQSVRVLVDDPTNLAAASGICGRNPTEDGGRVWADLRSLANRSFWFLATGWGVLSMRRPATLPNAGVLNISGPTTSGRPATHCHKRPICRQGRVGRWAEYDVGPYGCRGAGQGASNLR